MWNELMEILSAESSQFITELSRQFEPTRRELLERRIERQRNIDSGDLPHFLDETEDIRSRDWKVATIPADLEDRRVEITGPCDRKMVINALNCGANVFMADLEDANSPTWENVINGQQNLYDAIRRTIELTSPEGKHYKLNANPAVLMVRPRGWHLLEKHFKVDGSAISGSLFDFGLYFFHNAKSLLQSGSGPYFYLPKLESHHEARLWNDVFTWAQDKLGVPQGSIRATVLIETILASFEMDEILYELRDHSAGLNCGRWDYIFSFIKKLRNRPGYTMPNRAEVTMDRHFLKSYVELLIETCHRRGIHAMGGMAAQIPIKNDPEANERALEKVRQDKLREVRAGHDGTWVAHPALVAVAKQVFDEYMPGKNQIDKPLAGVSITAEDLLAVPEGTITEQGLRLNIDVGIQYLDAWLKGSGAVPIYNLMEDAATAEISRAQIWQWAKNGARLSDGRVITSDLVQLLIREIGGDKPAARMFSEFATAPDFIEFLTLRAYNEL